MEKDEIQHIIDTAYPIIQKYYGKGKTDFPIIELWRDIYARISGIEDMEGEHSSSSEAQYDEDTNIIYIYYPNMVNEEHVIRSIIHEYTHYKQNITQFKKQYSDQYDYENNPYEIEAHKNEENWQMFSLK